MRSVRVWIAVAVLLGPMVTAVRDAAAQGLAEVARAEEARRKTALKAMKVYTNEDLRPAPRSRQPPPAASAGIPPAPASAAAEPVLEPPPDPPKDEQYWRTRITAARDELQRSELFAEALQSRINALTTDFVNRDDPEQRVVIGTDRDKALAELDRVQSEIRDLAESIADIEEEARRAGVPPGWLR